MKVIKNINNNVSLCLDSHGKEVIAFGKGIGFCKPPYDLELSMIDRTFYDINPMYLDTIQNIPEEMIELSIKIIDYARTKVSYLLNSSIVFTLADHLVFMLHRHEVNMMIDMPIYYDVKSLYEEEYEVGKYAIRCIYETYRIKLPSSEIVSVALHLINSAAIVKGNQESKNNHTILCIKKLIEKELDIKISVNDFNYARFVSHMLYLLKRLEKGETFSSQNHELYVSVRDSFPNIYLCAQKVNVYLNTIYHSEFNEEEMLYLMLHMNRLSVRDVTFV